MRLMARIQDVSETEDSPFQSSIHNATGEVDGIFRQTPPLRRLSRLMWTQPIDPSWFISCRLAGRFCCLDARMQYFPLWHPEGLKSPTAHLPLLKLPKAAFLTKKSTLMLVCVCASVRLTRSQQNPSVSKPDRPAAPNLVRLLQGWHQECNLCSQTHAGFDGGTYVELTLAHMNDLTDTRHVMLMETQTYTQTPLAQQPQLWAPQTWGNLLSKQGFHQ